MKAGKPVVITSSGNSSYAKGEFTNSRGSLQPPKVATWIIEDPNYPQVDYWKRPLPTGVFFLCGG